MANKQKHPQKGPFKKSQSEKSQRNVNIIKHFHPNVQFNRYHLNCDIPEINADVETKEHFFQPKKHPIISKAIVNKAAPKSLSTKDEKNTVVKKVESYHMTKAVSSKIKVSIPSGSSSSTDYDVSPKYINSVNSLIIPNIRPSTSSSTSPSRANSTINKRNYQTKKAKTFSVNNKNKKKIIVSLRGNNESDEISSNNILNTRRNLISDLKQEIIDNQLRTPLPYLRKNNAIKSPNDDKVEHLREEIKNLINTNLLNKRKHLAEIKAEISNHQGTGDVLVYNVNIENSTNKSKDQREIENIPSNDNATIETTENIQQVRCSRRIERKPKSQSGSISRTLGQENDRAQDRDGRDVKAGIAECLHYPGTDDSIKSKIEQTNELILKLQQTLNEIRRRSQPSTPIQGVITTDTDTEKTLTDTERSTCDSDKETVADQRPAQEKMVVEVTSDKESVISTPKSPVMTPPKSPCLYRRDTVSDEVNVLYRNIGEDQELPRPKTRRSSKPDEMICSDIERFQNTPKVEAEAPYQSDTEFQILQAKLNTINEQTESDVSSPSEVKHISEEHEASASDTEITPNELKFRGPPTATISTQCGNSLNLAIETVPNVQILPTILKKTTQLVVQLLPPVNITAGPSVQKLMCFSIDSQGKTNFQFRSEGRNVGYFETESPSVAASIPWKKYKTQSIVRFDKIVSLPMEDLKSASADKLSDFDTDDLSNQIEESLVANHYPKELDVQTNYDTKREDISYRKNVPDQNDGSQQLRILYKEGGKPPSEEELNMETAKTPNAEEIECSSNFNLVDRNPRVEVRPSKMQKSVSDPAFHRTANPTSTMEILTGQFVSPGIGTKKGKPPTVDKDLIYKSFQLFKNNIDHDPGSLSMFSADLISNIDDAVYRTYINPEGFNRHTQQFPNKNNQKFSTLGKLSSLKFSTSESQLRTQQDEPMTDTHDQSSPAAVFSDKSSKLHNIGLFRSKSTQSAPLDEVALILKKQGKEYLPEPEESHSEISMVPPQPTALDNRSCEEISLTVSYSTDESSNESSAIVNDSKAKYPPPPIVNDAKAKYPPSPIVNNSKAKYLPTAEQEQEIRVVEPQNSCDQKKTSISDKSKDSPIGIPQDVNKFKQLKKKINEEHKIVPSDSIRELTKNDSPSSVHDITESIPNFITGLIDGNIGDLHKVIPHVRKTVQGAKKKMSLQPIIDKKEGSSSSYTIQTLQVRNPPGFHCIEDHWSISPLQAGNNGRYEDEENIFCENNYPNIEETLERRFKFNPEKLQQTKLKVDSSNSDTITSDKSFSEGEIHCRCSVSIGEMHSCQTRRMFHHRPSPFQRDSTRFRKKKTYFDNCVTYYFNKNVSLVNDSSSTS